MVNLSIAERPIVGTGHPAGTAVGTVGPAENPPVMKKSDGVVISTTKKGQVVQRNYVLNDVAALRKKKKHETRKEPYNLGTEARDGSNMVIQMKTSFFEHVKAEFIKDLVCMEGIELVENALGAKASTESSGEAFVEYLLDYINI